MAQRFRESSICLCYAKHAGRGLAKSRALIGERIAIGQLAINNRHVICFVLLLSRAI